MSDAARQNLKISREGIVLIKSFEGFRPRAIQRAEGGWIIGYGHTLSAREGASVSEADAELLLRYDLLPVEKTVNDTVPKPLNQHQFDALVSFAFSVGVDRFAGSDVRQRLNAGSPGEAADAMMGWPEPALPETALRRRAAERALFVANPSTPVALSDLLVAPLPPPAVAQPPEAPEPAETAPVPHDDTVTVDPRSAAVAALLGEPAARIVQPDDTYAPIIPTFTLAAPVTTEASEDALPVPSNDNPTTKPVAEIDADQAAEPELKVPSPEPVEDTAVAPLETPEVEDDTVAEPAADLPTETADEPRQEPTFTHDPLVDPAVLKAARYAPYSAVMVGPLPFLQPAAPRADAVEPETPAIDHSVVETVLSEGVEAAPHDQQTSPADASMAPVETFHVDPAPVAELILTPLENAPEPALERPLWTPEQRDAPDGSENNLFGEDLTLTGGGSIMRHEMEFEAPARFDWKDTAPFIFMGGVGLVSFGASMAAFRRAAEQSGGSELTIIGWVLALIGLACVGVSSVNLYRKFGLPGGD